MEFFLFSFPPPSCTFVCMIALRVHSDDTWLALFAEVDDALLWRVQTHRPSGLANLHEECGASCRHCERASL